MCRTVIALAVIFFASNLYARDRIFWLESYHEGYAWTDSLEGAIRSTIEGHDVELMKFHMDSKRKQSQSSILEAAKKAVSLINEYKPDIVIASDDNASKYVIKPHFKDASLPVIFCGVNSSVEQYGYPYKNATGIIETDPISKLIFSLSRFHTVNKVGYLTDNTTTSHTLYNTYKNQTRFICVEYIVNDFEEWRTVFRKAQSEVDILIVGNISAIKNWNAHRAQKFVLSETKIPTGCLLEFLTPYAFIGCIKMPEEQGSWAAKTALRVLEGTPIKDIPVTEPIEYRLIVNKKIAKTLKITLPKSYLERADSIIE